MFLGLSDTAKSGLQPIHGLRHPPTGDTTGWFIWAGELLSEPDFFKRQHVSHLREFCPLVLKFLGLPSGWRFLVAEDGAYEDVWRDASLLEV